MDNKIRQLERELLRDPGNRSLERFVSTAKARSGVKEKKLLITLRHHQTTYHIAPSRTGQILCDTKFFFGKNIVANPKKYIICIRCLHSYMEKAHEDLIENFPNTVHSSTPASNLPAHIFEERFGKYNRIIGTKRDNFKKRTSYRLDDNQDGNGNFY